LKKVHFIEMQLDFDTVNRQRNYSRLHLFAVTQWLVLCLLCCVEIFRNSVCRNDRKL